MMLASEASYKVMLASEASSNVMLVSEASKEPWAHGLLNKDACIRGIV